MYALIKDRVSSNQQFPLREVVSRLLQKLGMSSSISVTVILASGYGEQVNELDDKTEAGGTVSISAQELLDMLDSGEQWFYDLRASIGDGLAFGIVDSSAVLVEGEPDLVADVVRPFRDVFVHDGSFLLGSQPAPVKGASDRE